MIHARPDYDRIQDPAIDDPSLLSPGSTPIGADEPVMLFRAQDRYFPTVLQRYKDLLIGDPDVDPRMIAAVQAQIQRAVMWQARRGRKTPDIPREGLS